jgi:hypothetical protein
VARRGIKNGSAQEGKMRERQREGNGGVEAGTKGGMYILTFKQLYMFRIY